MTACTWEIEVDSSTPDTWAKLLDLFEDANIYQTWWYGAIRWGQKTLCHLVLKRNGEVVGMAQVRIIRPTGLKLGMAYLRWGPLCHRTGAPLDPEAVQQMACALESEYVGRRKLVLKILPNAFAGSARAELFQSAFAGFARELRSADNTYRTFVLDLTPSAGELRKKLDPKWRNKLAGAQKNGLRIVGGSGIDEYRAFCRMYAEMRNRKTFDTTVDVEEFAEIQEHLPEIHRMQTLICEQNGAPVAGLVVSAMGDSAIYLLGATSDDGLNAKGSYLLQWEMIQWLKDRGIKCYDLGGIDPELNPGVYSFKRGLSGEDVSQLTPLVAGASVFSTAIVRTSLAMHRKVQELRTRPFSRVLKHLTNRT